MESWLTNLFGNKESFRWTIAKFLFGVVLVGITSEVVTKEFTGISAGTIAGIIIGMVTGLFAGLDGKNIFEREINTWILIVVIVLTIVLIWASAGADAGIVSGLVGTSFYILASLGDILIEAFWESYNEGFLKRFSMKKFFNRKKQKDLRTHKITKHYFYESFLPEKKREEIMGDLSEIKLFLQESNSSRFQIWKAMTAHKIHIFYCLKKDQVSAWLAKQLRISK